MSLSDTPVEELETREVLLEKVRFGLQERLAANLLQADCEVVLDAFLQDIVVRVRGIVWAERDWARRVTIEYPSDWWEVFKKRWFPRWLRRRYPVKYERRTVDVRAVYPTFRQQIPGLECRLMIVEEPRTWAREAADTAGGQDEAQRNPI